MIVDHLLTRSAVRSVGLLTAAIVPLATLHFLYILAYNESPIHTVISELPRLLHILHSNTTTSYSDGLFSSAQAATTPLYSSPAGGSFNPSVSASSSSSPTAPSLDFPDSVNATTFLTRLAFNVASFLGTHGYSLPMDPSTVPGYSYILALAPLKPLVLEPALAFISSHRTLAWIVLLVHAWMAAELVFYIHFWTKLSQAQEVDRMCTGPKTRRERLELFERCLETIEPGPGVEHWVETWFDTGRTSKPKFSEVGRTNMLHWLAWAFWAAPLEEVFETAEGMMDINRMLDTLESTKKIKFAKGFNPDVQCIRLAFDPVIASHRPLVYYALMYLLNVLAGLVFNILGFTRFQGTDTTDFSYSLEGTKATTLQDGDNTIDPTTDLSYWHRSPVNPKNKVPLVFIHGIGIGPAQYVHWVAALTTISRPIILVEVPYVSNKLFKTDCMTPDKTYFALERILKRHNYPKATFMGHSLGTMLCAAVCRASPATQPKSIIAGLILADPICFLTHHSIARNFAYRVPSTASELIMDLFAAREIGTSWYIMRRFNWDQCIMFPIAWSKRNSYKARPLQGRLSPVLPAMTRVFLSRKDNLLDMGMIAEYLRKQVGLAESKGELVVMEDMDHAGFLLQPSLFLNVLKAAEEC
ncbi:hypothetical protein BG006_010774 [Podila minutissima]|uniref:AB hydrolase-1 domain-containing protein n=1 Tax=Podila minutissima TaxID=64525 RepID=A0A9P5SFK6_9FUNG|nr:hypothetical protein BG006_010774 [Podila minutissima]